MISLKDTHLTSAQKGTAEGRRSGNRCFCSLVVFNAWGLPQSSVGLLKADIAVDAAPAKTYGSCLSHV